MIITLVIKTVVLNKYRELLMNWFSELVSLAKDLFKKTDGDTESKLIKMEHFPFSGYAYMSWCGNIIYRKDKYANIDKESLWHETIHKLLASKKYKRWYLYYIDYLKYWIKGLPSTNNSAYYTIPYEMEAYANEDNPNYIVTKDSYKKYIIKDRKNTYNTYKYNWINYIKTL